MPDTQVKVGQPDLLRQILMRVFTVLLVATIFSYVTGFITAQSEKSTGPAGFTQGVVHGAMMPGAMLNLLVGRDVVIYATRNTGRTYKLGYTTGVNGCGAIFFGFFFWRFSQWRKRLKAANA